MKSKSEGFEFIASLFLFTVRTCLYGTLALTFASLYNVENERFRFNDLKLSEGKREIVSR